MTMWIKSLTLNPSPKERDFYPLSFGEGRGEARYGISGMTGFYSIRSGCWW